MKGNEPAFPKTIGNEDFDKIDSSSGMSLRQYYAAKAMQGLIAKYGLSSDGSVDLCRASDHAEDAFAMADAMIAFEEKEEK